MSLLDEVSISHRFSELPDNFYTLVEPTPLKNVRWVAWNSDLALELGFPEDVRQDFALLNSLSGTKAHASFKPLAMKYAGHQFGIYNPDLGDGRGLLLGEITSQKGTVYDLHLKGAGQTPYSRMGDGRAVLRSTIREYLCSEAMSGLGIPTTRALAMMVSDSPVYREDVEQGALLVRAAETHIRFGHFEHFFYSGQHDALKLLADKALSWYFPDCQQEKQPHAAMFSEIVRLTAEMIAHWQAQGFAHGVMNTDNMSILGQTFDYGPFGFMDDYEPGYICNHSDYQGRYSFDNQPSIALWNLTALAHALTPLISRVELDRSLETFSPILQSRYSQQMREKFGLLSKRSDDGEFFNDSFALMQQERVDYSRFFRELANIDINGGESLVDLFIDRNKAVNWLERYKKRSTDEEVSLTQRSDKMRQVNPKFILRNYLAQQAIELAQKGDFSMVASLSKVLQSPYSEHQDFEQFSALPPEWGKRMEISCSS
ncbi:protein adenylyltransferase SelO [Vibrio hangzhouensis]|uniref:protein adenylyltransferase SelO n=1 Tax=Vibrio hangzhouensis TaxID=462991 RepID=UPI001C9454C1|nr:YdiU family protein [Vibrio hangzhouensis]MBY6197670.1 YdiU family protein [Vibrio hangzhouensis]